MTAQTGAGVGTRGWIIVCGMIVIAVLASIGGIVLLGWLIIQGGAFGNWGSPGPRTVAIYDGLLLGSGDDGRTFKSITVLRPDALPHNLSIKLDENTERPLWELLQDRNEVLSLCERRPTNGLGHIVVGTCNMRIEIDDQRVTDVHISATQCKDNVTLWCDGTQLTLPMSRHNMEEVFGKGYRLDRG